MIENLVLVLTALVAGAFMPVQAGINAQLRTHLDDPSQAALVSFLVGTVALSLYNLIARYPWPPAGELAQVPLPLWTGGLLGAFFVAVTVYLAPRLGATAMMGLIIAGQLAASAALDHYGVLGFPVRHASPLRLTGIFLLVLGALLVRRY